ncbi:hypothetical protein J2S74_004234 [Evansella vedderi]|uniref:Uncharacterized protein n=1 Tax=Evansella vedderi TaxID=38282 RepID=A0ABU0A1C3_9BACI|nr:hypothetical protein [Evansella vedderi]MDQ0256812.1 hypothetical protein [Evansella vedderi]
MEIFNVTVIKGVQKAQFRSPQTLVWPTVLSYWFYGFVAALFFVALAEIIELLEKLNKKFEGRTALDKGETINRTSEAPSSEENSENSDEIKTREKEKVPTYKDYPEAWA